MDFIDVGVGAMIVTVVVDAIKEQAPNIKANLTRLIALLVGGGIGALIQYINANVAPSGIELTLVSGILAGAAAVGINTVATRSAGGEPVESKNG